MDSSKTLVQRNDRTAPTRRGGPIATLSETPAETAQTAARRSTDDGRIHISDERVGCRGELLLGRYRLFERLGAGGFGTVWRARDEQLDREVAVKRIALPGDEDRERATREAHATARLSHPAIVALYEASAGKDAFYLISELVDGDTLALLIAEDQLSDEDTVEIGLALIAALEHAHARGVIHRDLKPHNVLVPRDAAECTPVRGGAPAAAKLADFGGARVAGDDALTRTGDVLGTLAYMAPEQSEGHEVGPAADLYSLALVLYEAFSGVNPVRGLTPAATARRIGVPIQPLERRRRDLPRELTRALDAALHPHPDDRGSLADLHDALTGALQRGLRRRRFARAAPAVAPVEHADDAFENADDDAFENPHAQPRHRPVALPRLAWLGCVLAAAVWQAAQGRAGVALLMLAAGAPLMALPRRCGPGWVAAGLAPALGLVGLAGAFPALAGQRADWRARAALAALGFWWLALAESLLSRRLWLGPPSGLPSRALWEVSFGGTATHVVGAALTVELALGATVWALASMILPWVVRGRNAALDVVAAAVWTAALLAAVPLLERALLIHASQPSPRGALLGALLGGAVAVCARALRGPV